jgi:ABC-type dipeptide/oligopeptide/nickel transport system permease subunit
MIDVRKDDVPLELGWGRFWAKLTGAFVWMAASGIAALTIALPQAKPWAKGCAGLFVILSALTWLLLTSRQLKRSDEFGRNLLLGEISSGSSWALVFGTVHVGGMAIQTVFMPGSANLVLMGFVVLLMQPSMSVLFGAMMAQYGRWQYSRRVMA